tara:strand:+ start:1190 stop:1438 length:249 start_codon:yes stop_codon:yes gene_type:complete
MIYNHTYARVEYPQERGYRMEAVSLPNWLHITIETHGTTKRLFVHSRIHMTTKGQVGPDYSDSYTDYEMIKEQSGEICYRYE